MYLETFKLPIDQEEGIIKSCTSRRRYIENIYPCGIMSENQFHEINFADVTILYGGNGFGQKYCVEFNSRKTSVKQNCTLQFK